MILIPLTQERFALVDDEDADLLIFNWCLESSGKTFYARRARTGNRTERLHRVIADRIGIVGSPDHVNRCGLDCRRENLRSATHQQNCANRISRVVSKSGLRGVSQRQEGTWRALIKVNGTIIHLGTFRDKHDAARAYDAAAIKHFGEFAVLNFPEVK